jgi:hypothetical protein
MGRTTTRSGASQRNLYTCSHIGPIVVP